MSYKKYFYSYNYILFYFSIFIFKIYSITFNPRFIARQIMFLGKMRKRDWQFLFTYSIRAIRRVRQHIFNLTRNEGKQTEAERVSVSA